MLPDINEMFPQEEPKQFSKCTFCKTDIFIGDEVIEHEDFLFCDDFCEHAGFMKMGLSRKVVAGE